MSHIIPVENSVCKYGNGEIEISAIELFNYEDTIFFTCIQKEKNIRLKLQGSLILDTRSARDLSDGLDKVLKEESRGKV